MRVSIEALLDGHGMDETSPYIDLLLDEKYLHKNGSLVVTDMVTMAIKSGEIYLLNIWIGKHFLENFKFSIYDASQI